MTIIIIIKVDALANRETPAYGTLGDSGGIKIHNCKFLNLWSPGGSFMVQKMAISSPIPVFEGLMGGAKLTQYTVTKS